MYLTYWYIKNICTREVSFDDKTKITDNNDIITIHYYALKLVKYL